MNWLLPVVGGFLLLAAWDGHRKGFIKKSVGIVTMVLTLIITGFAVPYCTAFFRDKTALYNVLQKVAHAPRADAFGHPVHRRVVFYEFIAHLGHFDKPGTARVV